MKKIILPLFAIFLTFNANATTEKYNFDIKGAHAFIQFKIKHLGYSWLYGRFNDFTGHFTINRDDLTKSYVEVEIDTKSVDSNHAARDKHLRNEDFLDVEKYPTASFVSKKIILKDNNSAIVRGDFTLHGITKTIDLDMKLTGEGKDPWGGYRMGFEGKTEIALKDFNIKKDLGPASATVQIELSIEGIRE